VPLTAASRSPLTNLPGGHRHDDYVTHLSVYAAGVIRRRLSVFIANGKEVID